LNFKITIILSIIAISIGAFFYYNTNYKSEDVEIDPPWFYQVSMDDINYIGLTKKDKSLSRYENFKDYKNRSNIFWPL